MSVVSSENLISMHCILNQTANKSAQQDAKKYHGFRSSFHIYIGY